MLVMNTADTAEILIKWYFMHFMYYKSQRLLNYLASKYILLWAYLMKVVRTSINTIVVSMFLLSNNQSIHQSTFVVSVQYW